MRSTTAEYQFSPSLSSIRSNLALTRSPTAKGPVLGGRVMGATKDRAARCARASARFRAGAGVRLGAPYGGVGGDGGVYGRSSARITRQLRSLSGCIFDARRSAALCVVQQGSRSAGAQILRSRVARAGQAETFQYVTSTNTQREPKKRQGHKADELASRKALAQLQLISQRSRKAAAARPKYILTSSAHCYRDIRSAPVELRAVG